MKYKATASHGETCPESGTLYFTTTNQFGTLTWGTWETPGEGHNLVFVDCERNGKHDVVFEGLPSEAEAKKSAEAAHSLLNDNYDGTTKEPGTGQP